MDQPNKNLAHPVYENVPLERSAETDGLLNHLPGQKPDQKTVTKKPNWPVRIFFLIAIAAILAGIGHRFMTKVDNPAGTADQSKSRPDKANMREELVPVSVATVV